MVPEMARVAGTHTFETASESGKKLRSTPPTRVGIADREHGPDKLCTGLQSSTSSSQESLRTVTLSIDKSKPYLNGIATEVKRFDRGK